MGKSLGQVRMLAPSGRAKAGIADLWQRYTSATHGANTDTFTYWWDDWDSSFFEVEKEIQLKVDGFWLKPSSKLIILNSQDLIANKMLSYWVNQIVEEGHTLISIQHYIIN